MSEQKNKTIRRAFRGYSGARPDVLGMLDRIPLNVLDVGCGAGLTGAELKRKWPDARVTGVEKSPDLIRHAVSAVDRVIVGDLDDNIVQSEISSTGPFDLIICADILEHIENPNITLKMLSELLTKNGRLITSIPNVRHVSTFVALGIMGSWPRRERGIHDKTHLRFFTKSDIIELGKQGGLRAIAERRNLRLIESAAWTMYPARLFDFWPMRAFLTFQYLHLWVRLDGN